MSRYLWHFVLLLFSFPSYSIFLRDGDIILQPLSCYSCYAIAIEEGGPYSHMGLVIKLKKKDYVIESLAKVSMIPLELFLKRSTQKRSYIVLRNHELNQLYLKNKTQFYQFVKSLKKSFFTKFQDLPYDKSFLWDNFDENEKEKLYCSEFVTKILNPYLKEKIKTKKMSFRKMRDFWERYFQGRVPEGKEGNSPMDFFRSPLFFKVGEIENEH